MAIKLWSNRPLPGAKTAGKEILPHYAHSEIPAGISITRSKDRLILRRRWLCLRMWIYVLGETFFITGTVVVFVLRNHQPQAHAIDISYLFLLLAVGVFYNLMAILLNKTRITVDRSTIRIQHYPLFWPGNQQVDVRLITQFYVKQTLVRRGRGRSIPLGGESYQYETSWFELRAREKVRGDVKILDKLPSKKQALLIEHEIESFLGIQNQPVHGEVDPDAKTKFTFS